MRSAERIGAIAFLASAASAIALVVIYFQYPNTQLEGALLGAALMAFGVAFVVIAHGLLPVGPSVERRELFGDDAEAAKQLIEAAKAAAPTGFKSEKAIAEEKAAQEKAEKQKAAAEKAKKKN